MLGRTLLAVRLVAASLRRRPVEAIVTVVAIAATTTTLTLGLALHGVTSHPYQTTRATTSGPDVVVMPTTHPTSGPGSGPRTRTRAPRRPTSPRSRAWCMPQGSPPTAARTR